MFSARVGGNRGGQDECVGRSSRRLGSCLALGDLKRAALALLAMVDPPYGALLALARPGRGYRMKSATELPRARVMKAARRRWAYGNLFMLEAVWFTSNPVGATSRDSVP